MPRVPSAQLCGLAFGLSVAGAIFINLAELGLRELLPNQPLGEIQQVISGTSGSLFTSLSPRLKEQALEVIVAAWQKVYGSRNLFSRTGPTDATTQVHARLCRCRRQLNLVLLSQRECHGSNLVE